MATPSELDALIEWLHPHKPLPRDILRRTDTHQYLTYVTTHYAPCLICPGWLDCPPCRYEAARTTAQHLKHQQESI